MSFIYHIVCPNCRLLLQWISCGQVFTPEDYEKARQQYERDMNRIYDCPHCGTRFNALTDEIVPPESTEAGQQTLKAEPK